MVHPVLPPGWRLAAHATLDSTNAELRRLSEGRGGAASVAGGAAASAAAVEEGLIVQADVQTAGRGRRGRVWESPAGNLSCSVLVRVGGPWGEAGQLSFVVGVALHEALTALAPGLDVALKWPNDILLGGRKLAGILLETAFATDEPPAHGFVIVGTGANLATAPQGTEPLYPTATLAEAGVAVAPLDVVGLYAQALADWLARWRAEGFGPVRERWLAKAYGVGGPVTARLADGQELHGTFAALDADGALVLRLPSGETRRILAGDVFFGPATATRGA